MTFQRPEDPQFYDHATIMRKLDAFADAGGDITALFDDIDRRTDVMLYLSHQRALRVTRATGVGAHESPMVGGVNTSILISHQAAWIDGYMVAHFFLNPREQQFLPEDPGYAEPRP